MSSKVLAVVVVAAAVYFLSYLAHERFDRPTEDATIQVEDLGDLLVPLLDRGMAAVPELRAALQDRGGRAAELLELLPTADEAWYQRARELLADPPRAPYGPVQLALTEPRGLQVGPRPRVYLRREQPGFAELELLDDGGRSLGRARLQVNQWQELPADLVVDPGQRYEILLRQGEDEAVLARGSFSVLDGEATARFQQAMVLLKSTVADPRLRVFLQACLAMSQGMDCEATEIFLSRLPGAARGEEERGLLERMVYLFDRRGETVARDRVIARLLGD